MIIEQPSKWLRWLYPSAIWRMDPNEKAVYLTFDDGPIPESTPWLIETLDRYGVKATFFMVGDNVRKHPDEFKMVVERGHRIGNHTYNHLKGMAVHTDHYVANIDKADCYLSTNLFRPPHGLMSLRQYRALCERYHIIMWDLVTRDYNPKLNGRQILRKVQQYARPGSIITFHDSLRATHNLYYALPRAIEWLLAEGYEFKVFD